MDKVTPLYPLKFTPILKEKVWGGKKLAQLFKKETGGIIGESWELSGVEGDVSIVKNGLLKGLNLTHLIHTYKEQLVGKKVYQNFGNTFPLLFKFIDAKEDLSVQLHPDDALAMERHNSFGKTEMWYVLQAEHDARLILGFNCKMDEATYTEKLSENKVTEILHSETVKAGDSFFIAPGTVHAIGAGVVLAEIQQTSDITYRIYDWDRPGIDGEFRELHTKQAIKAINYKSPKTKLAYTDIKNEAVQLCKSSYFETNKLVITENIERNLVAMDSFVVYMCVEGVATFESLNTSEVLKKGETLLIPASMAKIIIKSTVSTILEIYIP